MYIAQLERDVNLLPRIRAFVQHTFPVVCDPDQISRKAFPLFNAYIIDTKGIIRTRVPGTLSARPSLSMILEELCKVEGVPPVKPRGHGDKTSLPQGQGGTVKADDVLQVQWMVSHDRIAAGDSFKVAFLPVLAQGFHVYAPEEKRMSAFKVELSLPQGVEIKRPLAYPPPQKRRDPFLDVDVLQYEGDVPMPALVFQATDALPQGECLLKAKVSYQACNDVLCYAPAQKTIEMSLQVVSKETKRNQVSGWKNW
jgi:hypothetical protein